MSHRYSNFSWWWAHGRPKHVGKRDKYTKQNCAPSWIYLQVFKFIFFHTEVCNNHLVTMAPSVINAWSLYKLPGIGTFVFIVNSLLDNADIKHVWRCTSIFPHVSMEWYFIQHMNNFTSRPTPKLTYTLPHGKLSNTGFYLALYCVSKLTGVLLKARWKCYNLLSYRSVLRNRL